jgi:hypothetical protein
MIRNAYVRLLVCALLIGAAAGAGARNVWGPDTKTLANAAKDALLRKDGAGQLAAAKLVKNDAAATTGFHKLISVAAVTADATKRTGIPPGIASGLGRLIAAHGEPAAKQFLKDMDVLYEWAKRADGGVINGPNMQMLGDVARKFGSDNPNHWKGAWFELQLAAHHSKSPPVPPKLQVMQPQMPPFHQQFRDAGIQDGNVQAYIEAKNWDGSAKGGADLVERSGDKLAGQVDNHFERMKTDPRLVGFTGVPPGVPTVPPGRQLHYEFSESMPPEWKEAIIKQAEASLHKHFKAHGMTKAQAKAWVKSNLQFKICYPKTVPFRCAPAP